MTVIRNMKIRPKLMFFLLMTSLLPLLLVTFLYSNWIDVSLTERAFNKLTTIQDLRKSQVENHFIKTFSDIQILASSERIHKLLASVSHVKDKLGSTSKTNLPDNRMLLSTINSRVKNSLKDYIRLNGYQDIYIVDADHGHILFCLKDIGELGTNLIHGKLKDGPLAETWKKALTAKTTIISDFEPYPPTSNKQMAFISHPILNQSDNVIGVLILRFDAKLISGIVESTKGMGRTGESYLLGWFEEEDKFLLRSNMKTMGEGRYLVGFSLGRKLDYWMDALEKGTAGGHDIYIDSSGKKVLVAYDKLDIIGLNWFLISKINKSEITEPIRKIYKKILVLILALTTLIGLVAWKLSRSFTKPIISEMEFADAIANGDLAAKLPFERKDEIGDLAKSLKAMSHNLREVDWLKSGKEKLDDTLRGELNPEELSQRCIQFFIKHLGADLGAIYLQQQGVLSLRASYAFSDREGNFNTFELGEGLVGQAGLEVETLFFSNIDEDAPVFNYGAGEKVPTFFAAAPLTLEGDLVGVILIGSLTLFTKLQRSFINQNIPNVAIIINAAKSRQRIRDLLDQANRQQEDLKTANQELEEQTRALKESEAELQAQKEELRVTNEELEGQTRSLKESEAELQAQQEELRVTNEELEERTHALEDQKKEIWEKNSELEEAQDIVERKIREIEISSKYKSEFLANMSHELRTPLNSILILSQLFANNKDGNLTEKQTESAAAIHSSGSELLNLINEILDLSKVEAGKIDLVLEDVQVIRIEKDIKSMFQEIAHDKNLHFEVLQSDNIPSTLHTDSQRLQQVIRNLLTNAFKFTNEGSVTLNISRPDLELVKGTTLDCSHSIAFSVKDDGIGIPDEKQAAIFEAFQQADGSTSRNYGGTGLGLSISKELAKLLGGKLALQSIEGKGSTFTIIIPETLQENEQQQAKTEESDPGQKTTIKETETKPLETTPETIESILESDPEISDDRKDITPDSKSLLVIEDDNNFSKILRDFARDHGFKCIVAENGEKGLHFADYYSPSAIILDIGLPGIDGWTVMERLKNNPKLRHIPVHFMSASDSSMDAMRMGAMGFLTKPVSVKKLEETLTKIENIISRPVRKLLLVEDDDIQRESIKELIGNSDVITTAVSTGTKAYLELQNNIYDCMILDLGLEDMSGFDLLEKIRQDDSLYQLPIIIYTGRELTRTEEKQLNRYAETIIIKGAKSPERLLDESALFLHRVEANLPEEKREMLKLVHDKEAILKGKSVMLVDDDMRNVFALSSVLEERNIDVIIARDGVECLEKLESEENIDGILMDIMMPRMDGYEAMQEIRKQHKYRNLPIIALTAKAMKGDRSKCIEAGASDYLAKPVNPDKLISMLRVWLY